MSGDFIQTADIDLSQYAEVEQIEIIGKDPATGGDLYNVLSVGWVPIGNFADSFTGKYNGDGFKITGLKFRRSGLSFNGLFGVGRDATIERVNIVNCDLVGGYRTQAVLGYNFKDSCTVVNCQSTGSVVEEK